MAGRGISFDSFTAGALRAVRRAEARARQRSGTEVGPADLAAALADEGESRASALQVRANALQRKAQQRDREISATEQKALARVGQELEPLIRQVYQQKQCSVLFQRSAVVIANPAMDITPQVVTALNAKITQFAFDRERLDQAAAPAPAAAAPAARK